MERAAHLISLVLGGWGKVIYLLKGAKRKKLQFQQDPSLWILREWIWSYVRFCLMHQKKTNCSSCAHQDHRDCHVEVTTCWLYGHELVSYLDSRSAQTGGWQVALRGVQQDNRSSAVCPTGEPLPQEEAQHLWAADEADRRQVSIPPLRLTLWQLKLCKFGELHGESPSPSWMEYR